MNNNYENIDDILTRSYNDIEIDEKINIRLNYRIKRYNINHNLKKIASISMILIIMSICIINISNKFSPEPKIVSEFTDESNKNIPEDINNLPIPSEQIKINMPANADISKLYEPEYIVIANIEKISEYISYVPNLNKITLPVTKYEAKTLKNIKGNMNDTFEFIKSGGVISLTDYEKTLSEEQIKKQGLDKKTKEEKENTYVEISTSLNLNDTEIVTGKTYLICMRYDTTYEEFSTILVKIGILEYDENTNSVKDKEENKWIPLNQFIDKQNI